MKLLNRHLRAGLYMIYIELDLVNDWLFPHHFPAIYTPISLSPWLTGNTESLARLYMFKGILPSQIRWSMKIADVWEY